MEGAFSYEYNGIARFLPGLRADGRAEKKINDFLLFTEIGEEQYKPRLKDGGAN